MTSTANMYRVGDYVYFEINTASPYQIRRIEELNKTPAGNVEAKVMCFYRRRDIGGSLLKIIDSRTAPVSQSTEHTKNGDKEAATKTTEPVEAPAAEDSTADKPSPTEAKDDDPVPPGDSEEKQLTVVEEKTPKHSPAPAEIEMEKSESGENSNGPSNEGNKKNGTLDKPVDLSPSTQSSNGNTEKTNATHPQAGATSAGAAMPGEEQLNELEKHRLLHRELFLSRQIETLPATHIRGKCTVTLLNELETPDSYLTKEDSFFYSLVYDPAQKTLLADKGEIRVGDKYQAQVPENILTDEEKERDRANSSEYETLVFHPHHGLADREVDQFLIVSRAIGTLARAFDMNSVTKYAGLHTTVAAASRDVTTFQAMMLLHQADYDVGKAVGFLVPWSQKQWYPTEADKLSGHTTATVGGPLMCRDQMEEWSAAESNLFEEALEKYGKDFNDIRQDFLPWKALKDIVEYYYMWKTTDRYIQQKRVKAAEAESRLKQVYIPTYAKQNPNVINSNNAGLKKRCEGCSTESTEQWYSWGPTSAQIRLCKECWVYWKKYGGLKKKHKLENFDKLVSAQPQDVTAHGVIMPRPGDRLEMPDFGGRVQRCSLPGCSMQFANLQTLNQHLRRDHGLPWAGQDTASGRQGSFTPTPTALASGTPPMPYTGLHSGPMRNGPRTRAPVFLRTTLYTKAARRFTPKQLHNPRHAARNPFEPINALAIRTYCQSLQPQKVQKMARVLVKMGLASASAQAAVTQTTPKLQQQHQSRSKGHSSSSTGRPNAPVHSKPGHPNVAAVAPMQRQHMPPQKRPSAASGAGQPPMKRARELEAAAERGGESLFMKWVSMPDDYYFHRTKKTKRIRRVLTTSTLRKMGRQPHRMHASAAKLLAKHGVMSESH